MEGDPSLAVPLSAAHVGPAETAGALDPHTLGAGLQGGLDGAPHGAPEGHPVLELVGDSPGQQLRVGLGVLDLDDVELHPAAGHPLDARTDPLRLAALASDHGAGPGGVDVDLEPFPRPFYVDAGDGPALQFPSQVVAYPEVLVGKGRVLLVRVPARLPVGNDPEAESVGVRLLAHQSVSSRPSETTIVMWQVRLRIRVARPRARGRKRLMVNPSSA